MSLAASDVTGGPVRSVAQALLAQLLLARGRYTEAKAMAAEVCRAKLGDVRRLLEKTKLCS